MRIGPRSVSDGALPPRLHHLHHPSTISPTNAPPPPSFPQAYQLIVSSSAEGGVVWDSGRTASAESVSALYAGPPLNASSIYSWTVSTWTASCASGASAPATFVTAAWGGFAPSASFMTTSARATFGYFRREVALPAGIVSAVVHLAGALDEALLCGWKFYIDGALVNVGPGRGEAPVWGGDGRFRNLPVQTLDVTAALASGAPRTAVLALQRMHSTPDVIFELRVRLAGGAELLVVSDATWSAFNGDVHRVPGPSQGGGGSAGTGFVEYIDARAEPVGWRAAGFAPGAGWAPAVASPPSADQLSNLHPRMQPPMQVVELVNVQRIWPVPPPPQPPSGPVDCGVAPENANLQLACGDGSPISQVLFASFGTPRGACPAFTKGACDANSSQRVVEAACLGKTSCSVAATNDNFGGDPCYDTVKELAVQLKCPGAPPPPPKNYSSFVAQFEKEFQGGLRLDVADGKAGTTVHITCGEQLTGNTVGYTWGWEFTWTLRDGAQTLEQHKYMECRWASITFDDAAPTFTLSAWMVSYPWADGDSAFSSSSAVLDSVYDLCRYTVHAAALDTYTDSNTRERTPYEADGIIAASGRLLVQRDYLFPRHSHAYVLEHPTWPVEWLSITPFLGWQDYMATGQSDLAVAFMDKMHTNSKIGFLDATGLLDTSKMGSHIVDWMPDGSESDQTVARGEFTASNYMSVTNMFAAVGLDRLATMVAAGGFAANASVYAAEGAALLAQIRKQMWNGSNFCDGVCTDPKINGNSRVMSNMYSLVRFVPRARCLGPAPGPLAQTPRRALLLYLTLTLTFPPLASSPRLRLASPRATRPSVLCLPPISTPCGAS